MTSFERLVASDPQRAGVVAPRDLDAMITRVVAQKYAHVLSWRAFKARVFAGFSASCAAMAVATYALAGAGPSLERLSFAASAVTMAAPAAQKYTSAQTGVGNASAQTGTVHAAARLLSGAISASVSSLASFTVTAPSSARDTVSLLANALGVTLNSPVASARTGLGEPYMWTARGENGAVAKVLRVGGVNLFSYQAQPADQTAGAATGLHAAALAQRALDIVHALGITDTGVPVVGTGTPIRPGAPTNVVVPILINAHWSNLSDDFVLDARGRVIAARGALFSLGPPVGYPLISPRAAASRISFQAAFFAHELSASSGVAVNPAAPLPVGTIRLTQAATQYRILVDAQGVAHALPIYQYRGTSGSREVVLDAVAIDPRYLVYEVHGSGGP